MKKNILGIRRFIVSTSLFCIFGETQAQLGIGVSVPNNRSMLEIKSTTKGFLPPRLTSAQRATIAASLTKAERGMLVLDSLTSKQYYWDSSKWTNTIIQPGRPVRLVSDSLVLNPGTAAGDLLSWDGINWISKQPARARFNFFIDKMQPYLVLNYCISTFGVFPSQNDMPYVGEIRVFGFNFEPRDWFKCDGQLLSIAEYETLFYLIGTTYGGDGQTTFALPDLRSRKPIHKGVWPGLDNIGQTAGSETLFINQ